MSKTQFKKELAMMDREQLTGLLLEAYDARKEIKEYFDFFLNPDIDKLTEKTKMIIAKEFLRKKRGYCHARITNIKAAIRDFASFQPGDEQVLKLHLWTIRCALAAEKQIDFPPSLINSVGALLVTAMKFASKALLVGRAFNEIDAILNNAAGGTIYFRRSLANYLHDNESAITRLMKN